MPRKRGNVRHRRSPSVCNQLITKQHRAFMSRQNPQKIDRPPRAPRQFPCFQRPVLGRSSTRTSRTKQETYCLSYTCPITTDSHDMAGQNPPAHTPPRAQLEHPPALATARNSIAAVCARPDPPAKCIIHPCPQHATTQRVEQCPSRLDHDPTSAPARPMDQPYSRFLVPLGPCRSDRSKTHRDRRCHPPVPPPQLSTPQTPHAQNAARPSGPRSPRNSRFLVPVGPCRSDRSKTHRDRRHHPPPPPPPISTPQTPHARNAARPSGPRSPRNSRFLVPVDPCRSDRSKTHRGCRYHPARPPPPLSTPQTPHAQNAAGPSDPGST